MANFNNLANISKVKQSNEFIAIKSQHYQIELALCKYIDDSTSKESYSSPWQQYRITDVVFNIESTRYHLLNRNIFSLAILYSSKLNRIMGALWEIITYLYHFYLMVSAGRANFRKEAEHTCL